MWGTIKIDGLWMQNEAIQTCGEYDIKCTIIGWETPGCKNRLGELNKALNFGLKLSKSI